MSGIKASLNLNLLRRTIRYDHNGKVVSDTITNHITGKTYPTPKRKRRFKTEKVVFT